MITPLPHQLVFADKCWTILQEKGYVYLAGKPRSGKTYTSILIAEKSTKINNVLVLTKKNAISGWEKFIVGNSVLKHKYTITNYEQAHKLNPKHYDLAIIDESHNLGTLGKPSVRIKTIGSLCKLMPHIHLSGTAIVESPCGIYSQMSISEFNPFSRFSNFYRFHDHYGIRYSLRIAGRDIQRYDRYKPELIDYINTFTVYMTQEDAGISKDLQAVDQIHYIELNEATKALYNQLQKDFIADIWADMFNKDSDDKLQLVCDSTMKLRTSLHMMESGVAKVDDEYVLLGNTEKVDYIFNTFGDTEEVGIMGNFIGERMLLEKKFKRAKIYSSTADAEGVDLSHLTHFVILSSNYSGAKFIQRRERIINTNGSNTLTVHHILVKKAISDQVYNKVSKKEDFNNSTYERLSIY
ncbi:MAG: hypothetical protein JHC33_01335 [Ignisphaera sp.]|nr:hypothetical protein [Ignisphaera sp.]